MNEKMMDDIKTVNSGNIVTRKMDELEKYDFKYHATVVAVKEDEVGRKDFDDAEKNIYNDDGSDDFSEEKKNNYVSLEDFNFHIRRNFCFNNSLSHRI
uniref:Uncharacterized protein n=1 Tax=Strongyloides venezuelensis TaxID=75913 RepID=A0A0K0FT05_STRVS